MKPEKVHLLAIRDLAPGDIIQWSWMDAQSFGLVIATSFDECKSVALVLWDNGDGLTSMKEMYGTRTPLWKRSVSLVARSNVP